MNCERDYKNNIFSRFAESAVSTQREEFRRWGVMADWARPYLTNSPDYDMFLRLYQARHVSPASCHMYCLVWTITPWSVVANR